MRLEPRASRTTDKRDILFYHYSNYLFMSEGRTRGIFPLLMESLREEFLLVFPLYFGIEEILSLPDSLNHEIPFFLLYCMYH